MVSDKPPLIQGCGVFIVGGKVQAAIDEAGNAYRRRFDAAPTHVALPPGIAPEGLNLGSLHLGRPSGPGVVIVGRPATWHVDSRSELVMKDNNRPSELAAALRTQGQTGSILSEHNSYYVVS